VHTPSTSAALKSAVPRSAKKAKLGDSAYTRWAEALDDEGNRYYWHQDTMEAQWEQPEEGFLTFDDQYTAALVEQQKQQK
jgi:hypothetical protein